MKLPQVLSDQVIGAEENSANARELHAFLGSQRQFADWIQNRISQYGFVENEDYIVDISATNGRPMKEYYVTLDMAKELCMVENNDKGRAARKYFIKCEKELRNAKLIDDDGKYKEIFDLRAENRRLIGQCEKLTAQNKEFRMVLMDNRKSFEAGVKRGNENAADLMRRIEFLEGKLDEAKKSEEEKEKIQSRLYEYMGFAGELEEKINSKDREICDLQREKWSFVQDRAEIPPQVVSELKKIYDKAGLAQDELQSCISSLKAILEK